MTTFNDQLYQYGGAPVNGLFTTGNVYFVKPGSGSDSNNGKKPTQAVATLSKALDLVTADNNDIIYMVAEDNSASGTTDYQSATLAVDVDGVHIVGVNAGQRLGQRSRIAQLSTATGIEPLVTWSASNSSMRNVHIFHGVADATSKGAMNLTGERNYFSNCHVAGIGHNDMDSANNYSLQVSGGAESSFVNCTIGLDTVARGTAANSEIRLASQATRINFEDCLILTYAEAAGHQFLIAGASSMDRYVWFKRCLFANSDKSSGTAMDEAFDVNASQGGHIILQDCVLVGAADWDAGNTDVVVNNAPAADANGHGGVATDVD